MAAVLLLTGLAVWLVLRDRPAPPIRSLAVLPLENLSGDPAEEYFSEWHDPTN